MGLNLLTYAMVEVVRVAHKLNGFRNQSIPTEESKDQKPKDQKPKDQEEIRCRG